ncbi:hypothetical protein FHX15_002040 [Rhizobium sp. BK650]|uniref:hypothetical protein n=1 Tax=Rhizobium sp. BK650 TaxID=2586990 RepID=UPI0016154128|nr:hypothetical protein [Rhizobium sp. BK650]MBB3656812.1 hypothetical protein [Rhizobium sp. BK650]
MVSKYSGERGRAPFRMPTRTHGTCRGEAIGMVQPLAGLVLAASFVLSLAGRYESQLVRAERFNQEVVGR